jgi:hypothetical protein
MTRSMWAVRRAMISVRGLHNTKPAPMPGTPRPAGPVRLVWSEHFERITDAIAIERKIKDWRRAKKGSVDHGRLGQDQAVGKASCGTPKARDGILKQWTTQLRSRHPEVLAKRASKDAARPCGRRACGSASAEHPSRLARRALAPQDDGLGWPAAAGHPVRCHARPVGRCPPLATWPPCAQAR